jgi:hypothetical protein
MSDQMRWAGTMKLFGSQQQHHLRVFSESNLQCLLAASKNVEIRRYAREASDAKGGHKPVSIFSQTRGTGK